MKTGEIADLLKGELRGDGTVDIFRVAAFDAASDGEISFVEKGGEMAKTEASCIITGEDSDIDLPCPTIKVKNPKLAFAKVAAILHPPKVRQPGIHSSAVIAENATLGESLFVGAFVSIGKGSEIGDRTQILAGAQIGDNVYLGRDCVIHPNVSIEDNSTIGHGVILHSGVVIGADGFGYVRDGAAGYIKFPQIGQVVIENDVEIGANTCIDRGALGETRIGEGSKIDNLVQIAHNVQIGKRVIIASQTGISGSTVIEDDCVIGGQVGFGDHARVMSGAVIGSQAGVLPGKIVRPGVWWGTPVQPLDEYKRQNAHLKGIARLKEEVKTLKREIAELKITK